MYEEYRWNSVEEYAQLIVRDYNRGGGAALLSISWTEPEKIQLRDGSWNWLVTETHQTIQDTVVQPMLYDIRCDPHSAARAMAENVISGAKKSAAWGVAYPGKVVHGPNSVAWYSV